MKFQLPFNDETFEVELIVESYTNNRMYVGLIDCADGGRFSDISSNFIEAKNIGKGEFVLKSWRGCGLEEQARFLLEKGIVVDTGKMAFSNSLAAQVCKLGANYKPI